MVALDIFIRLAMVAAGAWTIYQGVKSVKEILKNIRALK